MRVEFFRHNVGSRELAKISEVFESPFLTTGTFVSQFETAFATHLKNTESAVGVTSCTAALHLSLMALGIGSGDEVITTPLSFVATSNAVLYTGATPVFVDVEEKTGNIDVRQIEQAITRRSKAIIPVHLYGQMCDMRELHDLAEKHSLRIIEDSAHCIEGSRNGIHPGMLSDAACFSFHPIKTITCGEGGAIVCRNPELRKKLVALRLHGISTSMMERRDGVTEQEMHSLGWKYNMTNIQAALLLPQLDSMHERHAIRTSHARLYKNKFFCMRNVRMLEQMPDTIHTHSIFSILVPKDIRDHIIHFLRERGIETLRAHKLIYQMPFYRHMGYQDGLCPNAEELREQIILLPMYPRLKEEEILYVADSIELALSTG